MKKRQKSKAQDMNKAEKGMVPWSRDEFNWIEAEFHRLRANQKDANRSPGIHIETGIGSMDNLLLFMQIFQGRYSDEEFMAHFIRHQQILEFLRTHADDLIQERLIEVNGPRTIYNAVLIDTLCVLPLTQEKLGPNGDKIYTFSYKEVVNASKIRLNAHLN
jgi:hypothetical protein